MASRSWIRSSWMAAVVGLGLGLAGGLGQAVAQENAGAKPGYNGVEPGDGAAPGIRPRIGTKPRLTWIGFQPAGEGGGSPTVFFQTDREVSHRQELRNGVLVVTLIGAVYANPNARRPLDMRYFDGDIARITSRPVKRRGKRPAGIAISLHFKDPSRAREATVATRAGQDGFSFLMIDLGAGAS